MKQTTKCIRCLRKATCHAGHVLIDKCPPFNFPGGEKILAGWCAACWKVVFKIDLAKRQGCYGGWLTRYGIKDEAETDV